MVYNMLLFLKIVLIVISLWEKFNFPTYSIAWLHGRSYMANIYMLLASYSQVELWIFRESRSYSQAIVKYTDIVTRVLVQESRKTNAYISGLLLT